MEIAVCGDAAADENFTGGSDRVTYQVPVGGYRTPFTVVAELIYQPISPLAVDDLRHDETTEVAAFGTYYGAADRSPIVVAVATTRVR